MFLCRHFPVRLDNHKKDSRCSVDACNPKSKEGHGVIYYNADKLLPLVSILIVHKSNFHIVGNDPTPAPTIHVEAIIL